MRKRFRVYKYGQRARADMLYTGPDVLALYDISRNTLANWERQGLKRVDPPVRATVTSPGTRLYLGEDLNAFHAKRRADSKRPCVDDQLYCLPCQQHQPLKGREVIFESLSSIAGSLHWTCPDCGGKARLRVGPRAIERLSAHGVHIHRRTLATNRLFDTSAGCAD
jgi:hypothetical protein